MFKNAQANSRIYEYIPILSKDSVKYVAMAGLNQMSFDPDLLIITVPVEQAEIKYWAANWIHPATGNSMRRMCA